MASNINTSCVDKKLYYGAITLVTAGLITMFVCGILGQTGKLSIPRAGAAAMISTPAIALFLTIAGNSDGRGF